MPQRKPKILVADESALNRVVVDEMLQSIGAETIHAEHGDVALELLTSQPDIDLVLVGVRLADMDGLTLSRLIQVSPEIAGVPVVMKADDLSMLEYREVFRSGVAEVISSDEDPRIFLSAVQSRIRRRRRSLTPVVISASTRVRSALFGELYDGGLPAYDVRSVEDARGLLPKLCRQGMAFVDFRLTSGQACVFLNLFRQRRNLAGLRLVLLLEKTAAAEVRSTLGDEVVHLSVDRASRVGALERIRSIGD